MAIQAEHGLSLWVAREKATGAVVGDCGLPPLELRGPDVELGYRLGRSHWGRGLATDAATACLRAGFEELGLDRIVAVAHPDNAVSRRVLEKIGFVYEGLPLTTAARPSTATIGGRRSGSERPAAGGSSAPVRGSAGRSM